MTTGNGATKWSTILGSSAAVVAVLGAAAWSLVFVPMQATISANQTAIIELRGQIDTIKERVTLNTSAISTIEVQINGITRDANLRQVNDLRFMSLLWSKVYGQEFPSIFYAPEQGSDVPK